MEGFCDPFVFDPIFGMFIFCGILFIEFIDVFDFFSIRTSIRSKKR